MANERNPDSDPKKSPQKLLLILPVILVGGILWMMMRKSEESVTPVTPLVGNRPTGNRATPPIVKDPAATKLLPAKLTIFVPNDNAELERQMVDNPVKQSNGDPNQDYIQMAGAAMKLLEKKAPDLLPAGSFLGPVRREGDMVTVDFSKKWYDMPQWSQGSARATLTQDAIVNTLAMIDEKRAGSIKVQFLQDGKLATTFGELDLKDPLTPNLDTAGKG